MARLEYVKGLEGILDSLQSLPAELVSKGGGPVRASLRKGGVVFQKAYQQEIQQIVAEPGPDGRPSESSGLLEKAAIVSRKKPRPGFKGEIFQLRMKRSLKYPDGSTANKIGGILEFGDERVPAKAPMRKAFDKTSGQALAAFVDEMRKRTDAAIKKARKKGKIS